MDWSEKRRNIDPTSDPIQGGPFGPTHDELNDDFLNDFGKIENVVMRGGREDLKKLQILFACCLFFYLIFDFFSTTVDNETHKQQQQIEF